MLNGHCAQCMVFCIVKWIAKQQDDAGSCCMRLASFWHRVSNQLRLQLLQIMGINQWNLCCSILPITSQFHFSRFSAFLLLALCRAAASIQLMVPATIKPKTFCHYSLHLFVVSCTWDVSLLVLATKQSLMSPRYLRILSPLVDLVVGSQSGWVKVLLCTRTCLAALITCRKCTSFSVNTSNSLL